MVTLGTMLSKQNNVVALLDESFQTVIEMCTILPANATCKVFVMHSDYCTRYSQIPNSVDQFSAHPRTCMTIYNSTQGVLNSAFPDRSS